jgi:hypothetical protein
MKSIYPYLTLAFFACVSCSDKNNDPSPSPEFHATLAVAGHGENIKKLSPVAAIEPTEQFFISSDGKPLQSILDGYYSVDFSNDQQYDFSIMAIESENDTLRGVGLRTLMYNGNILYHPEPLSEGDTISNNLSWVSVFNSGTVMLSNKFITKDWAEPHYLAIRRQNSKGYVDFAWIKLSISDVNHVKIYAYLDIPK